MAEALYLVTVAAPEAPQRDILDGIHAVLINKDDAQTDAQIIASAEAKVIAMGHNIPAGYFDTVQAIGDLTSGPLPADTDAMLIGPRFIESDVA